MPLYVVKGQFRIQNSEPDGDSVHVHPSDPEAFTRLQLRAHRNSQGGTQLRLEAIDALETHYSPGPRRVPPAPAAGAGPHRRRHAVAAVGVHRRATRRERVTSATPEPTEGYILTRFADKYGRAVAFAYAGPSDHQDLSGVFVDEELLRQSVNLQLAALGLAYPTYYSNLFPDLRNALTAAATQAPATSEGCGRTTPPPAAPPSPAWRRLDEQLVILPKLFRRLVDTWP